ncbi:MAG: hypothetical protein IT331_07375 [Anaerolineae bacterium]|nr:hypothetical protein [Anaerolineae bacterium]
MEERTQLRANATPNAQGLFEVVLITAGQGNGWNFSAQVLEDSVKLWDGCECFVDHAGAMQGGQSLRNLCGVFYDVTFDEQVGGVRAKLKTLGPSGPLAAQLGKEWLAEQEPRPAVGFSADIGFIASSTTPSNTTHAQGREVLQITRVYSCDMVFEPARGGTFVRALNGTPGIAVLPNGTLSGTTIQHKPNGGASCHDSQEANMDPKPLRQLGPDADQSIGKGANATEQTPLAYSAEQAHKMRAQMCAYLLDAGLNASALPQAVQERIRKQFAGQVFEPQALQSEIDDARAMVSQLTGGAAVAGLRTAVAGMFNSDDQLRLAVEDLLGVERDEKEKGLKVARLSGIKELYMGMQGDFDLYGGFYPERARFQHTTTTFAGLVKNALNKAVVRHWNQLGRAGYDWWTKIAHVEHFESINQITWVIFGTIASLPTVAEGGEYTELKIADSPETSSFTKYGGYVGITLEAIDRDDTRKLRMVPRELASAGIRNISSLVAALFTSNSGVGPTLADGGALFNNTAVTTAGGHANLLTTALGTDYTAWDAAAKAMFNQPLLVANESGYYGAGSKMALDPKYCLVPRALKAQAEALFMPRWASSVDSIASAGGPTYGGHVVPITVPEWTDANDWAAVADPLLAPGVCIGERFGLLPEVFIAGDETDPAMLANDESRIKVRHFIAVGVADFRPLHKSNVT